MIATKEVKEIDTKTVGEHVKHVLEKLSLEALKTEIAPATLHGDNYLGLISRIRIEAKDHDGKVRIINWIGKSAPANEGFRKAIQIETIFEREIFMYEKVFPVFEQLQKEKDILDSFNSYPPCYYTCSDPMKEILILENMKEKGFQMADRKQTLDYEHVRLVLKEYAKFHALSFALKDQKPKLFEDLKSKAKQVFFETIPEEDFKKFIENSCREVFAALDPSKDKSALEKFDNFSKNCLQTLKSMVDASGNYYVFTHGDCWVNNMLFKYGNPSKPQHPTDLCLLDFQTACVASPALDLSYFLFANLDNKLRQHHYDFFMQEYHSTLCNFLDQLGSDSGKLFPWDVFKAHLKSYSVYGLFACITAIKIMVSDVDEAPDVNNCTDLEDMLNMFNFTTRNSKEFHKRLRDVVLHCERNNYI